MDDPDDPMPQSKCKFCGKLYPSLRDCTAHEKTCDKFIVIPRLQSSSSSSHPTPAAVSSTSHSTSLPSPEAASSSAGPALSAKRNEVASKKKILCKYCFNPFTLRKNCTRHEQSCQKNVSSLASFTCEFCGSKSNREDNHKAHVKKCQVQNTSETSRKPVTKTPCLMPDCDEEFFHKTSLINHLRNSHEGIIIEEPVSKIFDSIRAFYLWKDEEEERTFSFYSQKSGQNARKVKYFFCQHDGMSHSKRKTSRLNSKGRVKVGHFCIAKMQVWKDSDEKINVLYYPTHSHVCTATDFVHHPLSKTNDSFINERLSWGVSPTKILRDIQKKEIPKTCSPHDILNCKAAVITKKRIRERARKRRERMRYHKDEAKAVYLMVNKLVEEDDCVVLYKPYGADVRVGPKEIDRLPNHKELFMLGLQTKRQAQLMADHSHKILLVDETHGTNHHKYQLLSVMIVDDNRRGWPVGHLITSKSDADSLQYFFKTLKINVPPGANFNLNTVISDDDPALINSMDLGFCDTLGKLRHLLCKWHLLKAFKKNLRSHVPQKLVDGMMTELRVIVNEKDESTFLNLQSGFIAKYESSPECKTFITYYRTYYEARAQKWAMSFRNFPHANINTTGHIESFHHRLKKVYLKRKVNRRLDDLVTILLDIEWDDHIARVRESSAGAAFQPQEILMRHKRAMALEDDDLKKVDENTWDIKAASGKEIYYIVRYNEECTSDHCLYKCTQIACRSLCAHMYSCSCKDSNPLCKHVHKLHSLITRDLVKQVRDNETSDNPVNDDVISINEEVPIAPQVTNDSEDRRTLSKQLQLLQENLSQLSEFISCSTDNQCSSAKCNAIAHAATVTGELVLQLKYLAADNDIEDITHMEPVLKFNSNETLKTQASQIPSFKRPPAKRKRNFQGVSPTKKQAVVKDLLSSLSSNSDTSSNFTPPLSFVSNPCDVILKCHKEKITLLNLKSLEHQLPETEILKCKMLDSAFNVGWLYSSIINAYIDILEERYPLVLSLSSELALRASRGFSNFNVLQKSLQGVQKDVLILPVNLTGNHWCILAVLLDLAPAELWYYDPLQGKLSQETEAVLFQMCEDLKSLFPSKSKWDSVVYVQATKQTDSFNCGVHICAFADQMARKSRPYHTHTDIKNFRKDIYHAIVGHCLKRKEFDSEQCCVCSQNYSDQTGEDDSFWLCCKKCDQWYHFSCVGSLDSSDFVCPPTP